MIYAMKQVAESCGFDEEEFSVWAKDNAFSSGAFEYNEELVIDGWDLAGLVVLARKSGFIRKNNPYI